MFKLCNFLTLLKDCTGWVIDAKITGILYPPGKTNFFLLTENGFKGEWTALNVTNPIWNQHDWHNRNTVLTVIVNFLWWNVFLSVGPVIWVFLWSVMTTLLHFKMQNQSIWCDRHVNTNFAVYMFGHWVEGKIHRGFFNVWERILSRPISEKQHLPFHRDALYWSKY